jgi:hypothetical protein
MKTMSRVVLLTIALIASIPAFSSDCEENYKSSGSLLKKTYATFADFPELDAQLALKNLATQLPKEGLQVESIDEATGSITAFAMSSGKRASIAGRVEPLENGTRVFFSVDLPKGAFGNARTKASICRFVELAHIDPGARFQHELVTFVRTHEAEGDKVGVVESSAKKRAAKVAIGAIGGALLGALHAKVTGGDVAKEALIGAVAGGALTFTVTKIQDRRLADRNEVMRAQSYEPSQGYRTGVRKVTVTPESVKPGQKITIVTTYWALAPTADDTYGVNRYAGLLFTGDIIRGFRFNPEPFQFGQGGGEYQTTIELEIPAAAIPGTYSMQWVVDGQSTGAEESATFTIAG